LTSDSRTDASISTRLLTRVLIFLIAVWSLLEGVILLAFDGASAAALGAGLEDTAAKRLLGVHMLLLVPLHLLISIRFERYQGLVWIPFGAQAIVCLTVAYSIVNGDSDFGDSILAVVVSGLLAALLGFVWMSEQRTLARKRMEDEEDALDSPQGRTPAPREQI
jgi:hypothetical protein